MAVAPSQSLMFFCVGAVFQASNRPLGPLEFQHKRRRALLGGQ